MGIAFLGPRGTFSEDAAALYGGDNAELMPFSTIPALTAAVETGLASEAILPIENSIEGSISATLDLLIHETPLKVRAEVVVPVSLALIVQPGSTLADISVVASHPNPLGQSRRFLERCLPDAEQVAALSTVVAVEQVAAHPDRTRGAIGTERSASLFGLTVLAHGIQDVRANVTRFIVLGAEDAAPTGDDKTSIGFTVTHNVPGALFAALTPLSDETIQLTKVESRPTKAWLGEYVFLVDFEGHRSDPPIARALDRMSEVCRLFKVFGSYPRFPLEGLADLTEAPALAPAG